MISLPRIPSVYVPAGAASILFFVVGTVSSWSSPAIPRLLNATENPFGRAATPEEISWITSLITIGAMIGPFFFGFLADRIGRKSAMLATGVPFLISYVLMAVGKVVELFYFARFLAGIGIGGAFIILPMYLGEISESKNRGLINCLAGCVCCVGLLFSVCIGPFKPLGFFNTVLAIPPVLFLILFAILGVESPVYLIKNKQQDLAELALKDLGRNSDAIKKDILEMLAEYETKTEPLNVLDIFRDKVLRIGFISALGLLIFQQLSGINAIIFYSAQIFKEAGSKLEPHICTIILVFVQFASSFITPLMVDRSGRKTCLLLSAIGMVLSEGTLGIFCYLKQAKYDIDNITWIPLVSLTIFILFFNIGYGPLPWVIMAEMFSTKYRSFAGAAVSTGVWGVSFLVTKYFDLAVSTIGLDNVFFFSTFCCIASILFTTFYIVETKGKSLQEIQELLSGK